MQVCFRVEFPPGHVAGHLPFLSIRACDTWSPFQHQFPEGPCSSFYVGKEFLNCLFGCGLWGKTTPNPELRALPQSKSHYYDPEELHQSRYGG